MSSPTAAVSALKPTFEKHLDAVKWVIGLPVAILFGTTQFVDKIDFAKHPGASGLLFWIVVVSALTVVLSVWYYFVAIKLADEKLQGADENLQEKGSFRFLKSLGALCFYVGFVLFVAAFVLTVIGLIRFPSVQFDKTPPVAAAVPAPHFTISTSGPVKDRKGTHVHTFLLNQDTGEIWRMECSTGSGVQFVRVPVQDLPPPKAKAAK
jgi:hypothetical protein